MNTLSSISLYTDTMSDPEFTVTLKELLYLVIRASWALPREDQRDTVMRFLCAELEDRWGVSRTDLNRTRTELGLSIPVCGHCKEEPSTLANDMNEEGDLCADCYWEMNEEYRRTRSSK